MDRPNERSLHNVPVPRTGGFAILVSLMVGLILLWVMNGTANSVFASSLVETARSLSLIAGISIALAAVSFCDDCSGLPPALRFSLHGVAATCLVWGTGWTVTAISVPIVGYVTLGLLAAPLTVLSIMWMTNLYNFMDGMDGFAGGMTVLGFGCLGLLYWSRGHSAIGLFCFLLAGATSGFLVWNFPPARIFMGDVGSVPLGFLAGVISVLGVSGGVFDLLVPIIIFSPFIVDATVTFFKRLFRREKVWQAHRDHYYQRAVLAGWSHRKTVMIEYALMTACGVGAMLYMDLSELFRAILLGILVGAYLLLVLGVQYIERAGTLERLATCTEEPSNAFDRRIKTLF